MRHKLYQHPGPGIEPRQSHLTNTGTYCELTNRYKGRPSIMRDSQWNNRQLGFNLPRQQWSLLNCFRTEQGHCGACRRKWRLTDTDLCPCGETQTMSHIVESYPLTKLNGSLSRLHSADEDAVSWLTRYGS